MEFRNVAKIKVCWSYWHECRRPTFGHFCSCRVTCPHKPVSYGQLVYNVFSYFRRHLCAFVRVCLHVCRQLSFLPSIVWGGGETYYYFEGAGTFGPVSSTSLSLLSPSLTLFDSPSSASVIAESRSMGLEQSVGHRHHRRIVLHQLHYMHACMDTYIHTYIHTNIHTHVNTYKRTYIQTTYIHTYVHLYIRTYVHTYVHTYIHTYLHMYMRTYVHTYIHTYIHTHMRTYIF
jgi:hypothetical protein